jgi:hypothetical protein
LLGALGAANAADLPVLKAPVPVVSASGFYFWADGAYERVNLPNVSLGLKNTSATFTDAGFANSVSPSLNGWGVRGAVGYVFRNGSLNPMFGSNVRFEIGGSYVAASGTQSAAANSAPTAGGGMAVSFLNAPQLGNAFTCGASLLPGLSFNCATNAALSSDYSAWQLNGKVASDYQWAGALKVTPSLAVFGGQSRNNQTFAQAFTQSNAGTGVVTNTGSYNAGTSFSWNDFGARLGLDTDLAITPWMSAGVGGYVGFAARSVSFSGNDVAASAPLTVVFAGSSALSTSANATPFLANAEAHVTVNPMANIAIRAFAGLSYDSRVPGLAGPGFAGSFFAPAITTIPASINFTDLTSYYAGGGVTVRF